MQLFYEFNKQLRIFNLLIGKDPILDTTINQAQVTSVAIGTKIQISLK
jgi:hypothetical protein